jgi:hypothetical protein
MKKGRGISKYLHSTTPCQVRVKPFDSPFWKGLMKVKEESFARGYFKIRNGLETWFWEDCWMGDKPLAQQFPSLYNIVLHKNVLNEFLLNIEFTRNFNEYKWNILVTFIR